MGAQQIDLVTVPALTGRDGVGSWVFGRKRVVCLLAIVGFSWFGHTRRRKYLVCVVVICAVAYYKIKINFILIFNGRIKIRISMWRNRFRGFRWRWIQIFRSRNWIREEMTKFSEIFLQPSINFLSSCRRRRSSSNRNRRSSASFCWIPYDFKFQILVETKSKFGYILREILNFGMNFDEKATLEMKHVDRKFSLWNFLQTLLLFPLLVFLTFTFLANLFSHKKL